MEKDAQYQFGQNLDPSEKYIFNLLVKIDKLINDNILLNKNNINLMKQIQETAKEIDELKSEKTIVEKTINELTNNQMKDHIIAVNNLEEDYKTIKRNIISILSEDNGDIKEQLTKLLNDDDLKKVKFKNTIKNVKSKK